MEESTTIRKPEYIKEVRLTELTQECIDEIADAVSAKMGRGISVVEPEPLRRKTAEWLQTRVIDGEPRIRCTECFAPAPRDDYGNEYLSDYCPNCGASMRKEREKEKNISNTHGEWLDRIRGHKMEELILKRADNSDYKMIKSVEEPERKKGKWIQDGYSDYKVVCDQCGEPCASYIMEKPRDRFCKWCGADMRGEEDEEL